MIVLEANYSKKIGLPNYSSHSYVVSLRTEINDLSQVEAQSAQLYAILQDTVDKELQKVGFLPGTIANGSDEGRSRARRYPSNGSNGKSRPSNGNSTHNGHPSADEWACSEKQRALILQIVEDNRLNKDHVEDMARQLFGVGVVECNKMQASQLIEELLESTGAKRNQGSRWRRPTWA